MDMDYPNDPNMEYFPWKCQCGRINKKWSTECAVCYAPWTRGTRHSTQPKSKNPKQQESYGWHAYSWDDWNNWEDNRSRSTSRSSTRYNYGAEDTTYTSQASASQMPTKTKGNMKGKKGKKGKGQSKQSDQASPFRQRRRALPLGPPWTLLHLLPRRPYPRILLQLQVPQISLLRTKNG